MRYRLYHYWRSSSSWRVRWALALKKIECEFVAVSLLDDETDQPPHRSRNPQGFVPVLEFLETSAPFQYLAQSIAILEYLEETHPHPFLLPQSPFERARVRQLAQIIVSDTQPIQNPGVASFYSKDPAEQKKWNQHWIRNGLESYEKLVAQTCGRFSFGDQVTIADLCLIPQLYNATRFEVPLGEFPHCERILLEAKKTAEYLASEPERFRST